MLFTTGLLGKVEVDESRVIEFPDGIPGFENCTRFNLFHDAEQSAPQVFWMQSLDDPDLLFSVVSSASLELRYEIELSDEEVAKLKLKNLEDIAVMVMVYKEQPTDSVPHPLLAQIMLNLRNPLVVNLSSRQGLQKMGLNCDIVLNNRNRT